MLSSPLLLHKAHCYLEMRRNDHPTPDLDSEVLRIQPGTWNQICQTEHMTDYMGMAGTMNLALVKDIHLQPQTEML